MKYLTVIWLSVNAWTDWRSREIDCRWTLLFWAVVFLWRRMIGAPQYWMGLLPGLGLWLLSFCKKEAVGSGDGIVTAALGWAVGWETLWTVAAGAFLLAGLTGIFLSVCFKKNIKTLPFLPFLLGSYLMNLMISGS